MNELLDIFYVVLTDESRSYLDSCAGFVFRERTPDDAEELMGKIAKNHEDWSGPEPPPPPKKRGMLIRPKCITILYRNSPLFIDIFHVMMLFLCCFGLFYKACNFPMPT